MSRQASVDADSYRRRHGEGHFVGVEFAHTRLQALDIAAWVRKHHRVWCRVLTIPESSQYYERFAVALWTTNRLGNIHQDPIAKQITRLVGLRPSKHLIATIIPSDLED